MTATTKSKKQREKFFKTLEESYWDMGILANKLIEMVEKERLK